MNGQLYIDNQIVTIPDNSVIALQMAVNSLYEMKTVQGGISNKITLPFTADNMKACGFPDDMNVDFRHTVRKKKTCRYVQNGVEVIPEGVAEVTGFTEKGISVFISFGNTDFFDLIPANLTDLEFPEYDHTFNLSTVISLNSNPNYTYPVIQYGQFSGLTANVDVRYLRPALFAKAVLAKIVTNTGYTLDNQIGVSVGEADLKSLYDNLLIPFSGDSWAHGKRFINQYGSGNVEVTRQTSSTFTQDVDVILTFENKVKDTESLFNLSTGKYVANKSMAVDISVDFPLINVTRPWLGGIEGGRFSLWKNLVKIGEFNVSFTKGAGVRNQDFKDQSLSVKNLEIVAGDQIYVTVDANDNSTVTVQPVCKMKVELAGTQVVYGQNIQLDGLLPSISQKDFLKAISALFCCIIQTDNKNKKVSLVPFSKIKDNLDVSEDWSEKITGESPEGSLTIGSYGQKNYAKWKKDDGVNPETYGRGDILIADENLDAEKDLFELPFSASLDVTILGGLRAASILKIKDMTIPKPEMSIRTQPRLVVRNPTELNIGYTDGTVTTAVTGAVPLCFFESGSALKLGLMLNSLMARAYKDLTVVLNDQRRITLRVRLSETDIAELDFFKPVYIARFGAHFYISKITDYTGNKPCRVDLIKLY